jgi:hypothetical protein
VKACGSNGILVQADLTCPDHIDPLGLDAALQTAASWDGFTHGGISAPVAIQRLDIGAALLLAS